MIQAVRTFFDEALVSLEEGFNRGIEALRRMTREHSSRDEVLGFWNERLAKLEQEFRGKNPTRDEVFTALNSNRWTGKHSVRLAWGDMSEYSRTYGYIEKQLAGHLVQIVLVPPSKEWDYYDWYSILKLS